MTGKKKNAIVLRRRQFLLALAAVCLIAVIAEAVLLIRTFSKKKDKSPAEATPTEVPRVADQTTVTPSPIPIYDSEPVYTEVWRLAKEKTVYSDGTLSNCVSYEYDELGRESKRIIYGSDCTTARETILFHYDRSGIVITEHWAPDENGSLVSKRCFYPTCNGVSTDFFLTQNPYLSDGEILEDCAYDDDGNLTGELKAYHEFMNEPPYRSTLTISKEGLLISHAETDPNGESEVIYSFTYDETGRLSGITKSTPDGEREYAVYRYEDERTYIIYNSEDTRGYIYEGGYVAGYFSEYGNDAWERMTREENPDRSIEVGYEMVYHFPKGRFPHNASVYAFDYTVYAKQTTARVLRKTEFREDGQPLKDIRSKDGLEDVRISSNTEAIDFVYSDNGLLSEIVSADETVFLTFDRNDNLTRLQNETYKYTTDYEWTAVQIPGLY